MSFYEAKKYLSYRLRAKDEHSIHSPFVFDLYTQVIRNHTDYYAYGEMDDIRDRLLEDHSTLSVQDPGAGSKRLASERTVKSVAKLSVIPRKYGQLLFRLVNHFQPGVILELGTSLGISALYMHKAAPKAELITVEGDQQTYNFAKRLISSSESAKSVVLRNMYFSDFLEKEIAGKIFDFIYIDGDHTYEATITNFKKLLPHITESSVLIFDDIYWSEEMTRAWKEIKMHERVTVTIDLFRFGIVFFRKENKQKENFRLRY